ncbi:class I SAM-dependent methyltransferase [Psychromarinibacter sp. C21-152]|uniref:Class I SAM-dependent methyltransferase n=1 Tax=Psychromarinibacter sediminicola TaxID=3033385 RepID=A0AAE3T793_9RHOB|nr:class I SAM-dependent methyltransferase [Psychromarinibacter sediminicola]MDF0600082.1 class I SAM-dependent methyltransferase [Psychromarinibacter sediminicola]
MAREASGVIDHYTRSGLLDRIDAALAAAGHDPASPTVEALSELDHLHGGGFGTTVVQAELAGIPRGAHVLDAGCGIGGPSRYLASVYDCTVEGVDLTPDYVAVARTLNRRTGLDGRITVTEGSVTDLPQADARFDVVLCQNVSMNVADKEAMAAEAHRVLRPGGIYTISHVAEGPAGAPIYPLPWARTPEVSFLGRPEEMLETLRRAGFRDVRDRMGEGRADPGGGHSKGAIGPGPAMGDDMAERLANVVRSLEEGRLVSMLLVARKG